MTKTLKERIAELEKLDAERTPTLGDYFPSVYWGCEEDERGGACIMQKLKKKELGKKIASDVDYKDACFLSAAPEMMEVIREQQRLLEMALEALESYARPKVIVPYGVAKNALTEIRKEMGDL